MQNFIVVVMLFVQIIRKTWRGGPLGKLAIGCGGFFLLNCLCSLPFLILGPVVSPQQASSTSAPAMEEALPEALATSPATGLPVSPAPAPTGAPSSREPASPAHIVIVAIDKRAAFVDIQNLGGAPQDLAGWHLLSERGDQDCLLAGVIHPDETLRIWAMAQDADKGGYNCGFDSNIWDTGQSDPPVLLDAEGREVNRM